jgi:hypothetical protein
MCHTKKLLFSEVSGCLVENPECGFAHKFGFSFVCRHPDHAKFQVHVSGVMTRTEANERYDVLRQKRRDEFLAGLDDYNRKNFSLKTDFHGQPLNE